MAPESPGKGDVPKFHLLSTQITTATDGSPIADSLTAIFKSASDGIKTLSTNSNPSPDVLKAYAEICKEATETLKLYTKTTTTFYFTGKELEILVVWALGTFLLLGFAFWLKFTSSDSVSLVLYWSGVIGVLLGAKSLSSLTGSGNGTKNGQSK